MRSDIALSCLFVGLIVGIVIGVSLPVDHDVDAAPGGGNAHRGATQVGHGALPAESLPDVPTARAAVVAEEALDHEAAHLATRELARASSEVEDVRYRGTITGRVVDEAGHPIPGARIVSANGPSRYASYGVVSGRDSSAIGRAWTGPEDPQEVVASTARAALDSRRLFRSAESDGSGRFRLTGLREGRVKVDTFADGFDFKAVTLSAGADVLLVGRRVHRFEFDVTLENGLAPASAVLELTAGGSRGGTTQLLRWTPDSPEIRTTLTRFIARARTGEIRRVDRAVYSDGVSDARSIDLAVDGEGPHELAVRRAQVLVVTIQHTGTGPRLPGMVLNIAEGQVPDGFLWTGPDARALRPWGEDRRAIHDIAPGTYSLGYRHRTSEKALTQVAYVGEGRTDIDLLVPPAEPDQYLLVSCSAPGTSLVPGLEFRSVYRTPSGSGNGPARGTPLGATGKTLIPWAALLNGNDWTEGSSVTLSATAPGYGTSSVTLETRVAEVEIAFQPTSTLEITLAEGDPSGYVANASPMAEDDFERALAGRGRYRITGYGELLPFDSSGRCTITGLQPGRYRIGISRAATDRERQRDELSHPLTTLDIVADPGQQSVELRLPALHDLVVFTPGLEVGAEFSLRGGGSGQPTVRRSARVTNEGRVTFVGVPEGKYRLRMGWPGEGTMDLTVPTTPVRFEPQTPR